MLAILASLTLGLMQQGTSAPGSPQEIPCRFYHGIPIVEIQIDQRPYNFVVDTGIPATYMSPTAYSAVMQADKSATLTLGNATLPVVELGQLNQAEQQSIPGVDGYIGRDVLRKLVFGIDYEVGRFYVWSTGGEGDDWVKARGLGAVDSGFSGGTDEVPFCMLTPYGRLILDTGAPTLLIPDNADATKSFIQTGINFDQSVFDRSIGKVELEIIPRVESMPVVLENMPALVTKYDTRGYGALGAPLLGPRLVIDGPGKSICNTVGQDSDYELWLVMSLLLPNIKVTNGKVYMPIDEATAKEMGLTSDPWAELVSFNDVKTSDLLTSYSHHDPAGSQLLQKFFAGMTKKSKAELLVQGNLVTADIDAVISK